MINEIKINTDRLNIVKSHISEIPKHEQIAQNDYFRILNANKKGILLRIESLNRSIDYYNTKIIEGDFD